MTDKISADNVSFCKSLFDALTVPMAERFSRLEIATALEEIARRLRRESAEQAKAAGEGRLQFFPKE